MAVQKPLDLVRFVSNVPVLNDGTIPLNQMDGTNSGFTSNMYTPVWSLSALARMVQQDLNSDKIELVNIDLDPSTIVYQALNSDLSSFAPDIYLLLRAVVLESFALLYAIETGSTNLQYVSDKDFLNTKNNIGYIADYFSSQTKYYGLIDTLRIMRISFGYVENQVDVIMNDRGVI
jgi:hypothetical protein